MNRTKYLPRNYHGGNVIYLGRTNSQLAANKTMIGDKYKRSKYYIRNNVVKRTKSPEIAVGRIENNTTA